MKKIAFLLLALSFSFPALGMGAKTIGSLGAATVIDIDGVSIIHPEPDKGILVLVCRFGAGAGSDCVFRKPSGTDGYKPLVNIKYVALAMSIRGDAAAAVQMSLVTVETDTGQAATLGVIALNFMGDSSFLWTTAATQGAVTTVTVNSFELTNASLDFIAIDNKGAVAGVATLYGFETTE